MSPTIEPITIALSLARPAKKAGGDRYVTTFSNVEDVQRERPIYVPQVYSRGSDEPKDNLSAQITNIRPHSNDWIDLTLVKRAKGSGDDAYHSATGEWNIYLPKEFRSKDNMVFLKLSDSAE